MPPGLWPPAAGGPRSRPGELPLAASAARAAASLPRWASRTARLARLSSATARLSSLSSRSTCCRADSCVARALVTFCSAWSRAAVASARVSVAWLIARCASAILFARRSASAAACPACRSACSAARRASRSAGVSRRPLGPGLLPPGRFALRLVPGRCRGGRPAAPGRDAGRIADAQARVRQRAGQAPSLHRRRGGGVGQRRLEGGVHLPLDLKAGWPAVPGGDPFRLGDQAGDQRAPLRRQFPYSLPGEVLLRLPQRLAERHQLGYLVPRLTGELVDQPRAHHRAAQPADGLGEITVAGRARLRGPLVAGRGEVAGRERVQILGRAGQVNILHGG